MADVVALECSLTLSPRALEVSPMYDEVHPSALHSQWYTRSFFWSLEILSFGCISMDFRVLTPLKHTCTGVYLKIFLKDSLSPGK